MGSSWAAYRSLILASHVPVQYLSWMDSRPRPARNAGGRAHYADYGALLTSEGIERTTETPTYMAHDWDTGWVPLALAALYQDSLGLGG